MRNWKIILGIFLLTILSSCLLNKKIEPFNDTNKGTLYLLLEAEGFNVPELNTTQQIMDPKLAQSKFNKVVVIANSAKYKNSNDGHIMNDQWNNTLVSNLGLFDYFLRISIASSLFLSNLPRLFSDPEQLNFSFFSSCIFLLFLSNCHDRLFFAQYIK